MADHTAHMGDPGEVQVEIRDANGNITDNWDVESGLVMQIQNAAGEEVPGFINIVDDGDGDPSDAVLEFVQLTTEDLFLDVRFDGRVGPDVNEIHARSGSIAVVPGEATGATVLIRVGQVE